MISRGDVAAAVSRSDMFDFLIVRLPSSLETLVRM